MEKVFFEMTFSQTGDFEAMRAAETFLQSAGFSIGSWQRGAPCGVMFGDYGIAKWRNLSRQEQAQLHGILTGDGRNGPLTVTIFETAPIAAVAALDLTKATA